MATSYVVTYLTYNDKREEEIFSEGDTSENYHAADSRYKELVQDSSVFSCKFSEVISSHQKQ